MADTLIAESDLTPEVRGYIARLQEENRHLRNILRTMSAVNAVIENAVTRTKAIEIPEVPEGVHRVNEPKRQNFPADDEGPAFSQWSVSCVCGWEDDAIYKYELAEYIARQHCGYASVGVKY